MRFYYYLKTKGKFIIKYSDEYIFTCLYISKQFVIPVIKMQGKFHNEYRFHLKYGMIYLGGNAMEIIYGSKINFLDKY